MKVVLAGGGTGGHVIPALAIAHELRARHDAEIVFVGTSRGIENRLVPAAGYELRLVDVGALKQVSLATRIKTLLALPRAIFTAHRFLADFHPDVVIGVGGYASGPAMLAAILSNLPTVAFEPNLVPGFANKIVGVMVSAAAVQFEATCRYFENCHVTGVPVRQAFLTVPPLSSAICQRGDQSLVGHGTATRPTLLVFGGSQGAHAINQAVVASLPALNAVVPGIHIVHQTGERDYHEAQAAYLAAGLSAEVAPFIDDMPAVFARADLLLCRSGASTVAEITAAGRPAIFVPFPKAADDHQTRNAEALCASGAAVLLPEAQLTPERLVTTVCDLLTDRARLIRMAEAARRLAHPHAARDIAALAARVAGIANV